MTDNLNTHASESLVLYVADCCGIETELGVKGRHGILKSLQSRRNFLTDKRHRIRFVYTPKHCSWLNQIEIWFGTLRKKLTRSGSFCSLDDLQDRIQRFIKYYHETMAKLTAGRAMERCCASRQNSAPIQPQLGSSALGIFVAFRNKQVDHRENCR